MRLVTTVCFLIIVAGAMYLVWQPTDMVWVYSSITGKDYEVKRAPDQQRMADRLAMLEQTLHTFLDRANAAMPSEPRIQTIRSRWDGTLSETEASEDVAFSIDKTSISLCLRDSLGRVEEYNASVFVLIHELAHIATSDYGHSPEFWENMKFLLEVAEKNGLYTYTDYSAKATTYCGHPLGSSPLTCVKQRTCSSLLT